MKLMSFAFILGLFLYAGNVSAQETQQINLADSTGLPGDHFSLQGTLEMFKESKSLEEFEKRLNDKDNSVNNLDLNADGKVDYVRVVADKKDDVHIVVLQVPVSKNEIQDVAVIEIEKNGDQSAYVQILGDEVLYGETIIVEPKENGEPSDPGVIKKGPAGYSYSPVQFYFNVWHWPCVQMMYAPVYVVYISPWYWDYWPGWWSPWRPYPWRYYYMSSWHHHHHYHYADYHYATRAHAIYAPRRTRSQVVADRYRPAREQYKAAQTSSRPRPGAVISKPRPGGTISKPGTRPTDPSQVRPVKPQSKPGTRPDMDQAPARPRPETKPQSRPQTKPDQPEPRPKPQVRPQSKPQIQQPSRPQSRPANKPQGVSKPQGGNSRQPQ